MKNLLTFITALILSVHVCAQESAGKPHAVTASDGTPVTLYGCVISSGDYSWSKPGMYSFPADKGYPFTKVVDDLNVYGGGTVAGSDYYAIYYWEEGSLIQLPVTLSVYDTETWELKKTYKSSAITGIATDLAYDHRTKNIYGCFMNFDYSATQTFGRLVFDDVEMTYNSEEIGQFPERMMALTVDADGQLYAFGASGKLYKVNKNSGDVTVVGDTNTGGMQWGWQSACYDKASGKIFWTGNNDMFDQCLFEVNPETAATKVVANYSDHNYEQVIGLFIKQEFADVKIPGTVSNFGVAFEDASLMGSISFVLPDKYTDGTAIEGGVTYRVMANGSEILSKEGKAGSSVTENITVPTDDIYTIMVTAVAEGIESEAAQLTTYIGNDTPSDVMSVFASMKQENENSDFAITLKWDEVTSSVHGGYIDLPSMTYRVVRYPGKVTVAEDVKQCTYTDILDKDSNGRFYYEVSAVCNGKVSEPVKSNSIKIGGYTKYPYKETFDTKDAFDNFTVIDANNDGSTWTYSDGYAIYTYNQKNAADDWLITPAMALRSDRYYVFKFTANNSYPVEKVAAYVGTAETAEAMTVCVVEPTEINYGPAVELKGTFKPEKNGRYYFGIKAMSEADRSTMYVDNIIIEEKSANGPKAVSDLVVKAGEKGALKATVSFTTPTECIDDTPLTEIKSVRIKCNDVLVKELDDVLPGTRYDVEDNEGVVEGNRTYTVEVRNDNGYGKKAEATVYVGIDVPGKVLNLRASEDPEGTVVLTWDAPAVGQHGGYVDPEGLTYMISKGAAANDINNGNSREFRDKLDISAGKQVFEGYNVYADNSRGSGRNVWQTIVTVAGPSVTAPMHESISGMHMGSGPWVPTMVKGEVGEASWIPVDGTNQKSGSQDRDGGLWIYKAVAADKQCRIESPKVDIRELSAPQVSFWLYADTKDAKVDVSVSAEFGEYETIGTAQPVMGEGWTRYSFDLSAYKNRKFVRIGFTGCTAEAGTELISLDNVSVSESVSHNLQLVSVTFPQRTVVAEKSVFEFSLRNTGVEKVNGSDYTIELYKNGRMIKADQGIDMQMGAFAELTIEDIPTVSDKEVNTYYVNINYPADEMTSDNVSEEVKIALEYPTYPVVTDVKAQVNGGAVALGWNAPDLSNMAGTPTTDSFEMYEKFSIDNYGDWTVFDGDKLKTILISLGSDPLDYPNAGKPMAWQVFNSLYAGIPFASWVPKTGDQMLVSFKAVGGSNDDWLISPELSGKAQTISFYAKTGMNSPYIPELLEVLYSTTDRDVSSFKQVDATIELDNVKEWNYYKFDIPEGARYFALRCVSNDKFALLVDDVRYIAKGARQEELALAGYNVYRDDVKLNAEPLADITYIDTDVEADKDYVYNVTAVYDKGESRYSAPCMVSTTDIENVSSADNVVAINGGIRINAAEGEMVSVYDISGAKVYSGRCSGPMTLSLQQGSYIVRIGSTVQKVSVN